MQKTLKFLLICGFIIGFRSIPLASAAEVTDVADAAHKLLIGNSEQQIPISIYLDDSIEFLMENGIISREVIDLEGRTSGCSASNPFGCQPVDELRYTRNTYTYKLHTQIGIYQDLAITLGWSYIIGQTTKFGYAPGVTAATSTVNSSDTNIGSNFNHKYKSSHKGSGALEFGFRYAPLSDELDQSKPMWVLACNWAAPWSTKTNTISRDPSTNDPGPVGDGMHYLTFSTALSKRLGNFGELSTRPNANRRGYLDPYIEIAYVWPIAGKNALPAISSSKFAKSPSQQIKFHTGFEIIPYEDLRNKRKLAIDLGLKSTYFTRGRNYSLLTDPLKRLTYTEQYLFISGVVGIYAQIASFVRLKLNVTLGYQTPHLLTGEREGQDRNNDGRITTQNEDPNSPDIANPYFCGPAQAATCANGGLAYDQIGMRFKDANHVVFGASTSLLLTF
ncbi:MAG: hypothetical protein JW841_04635 [Deltaproteobacteria bacterium]|nr:hypothetical protein [Deltaproteobacteria bacterium]